MYKQLLLTAIVFFALISYASAVFVPFSIDAQLTGDPRDENPDGMVVDVTVDVLSEYEANWTVDLSANSSTGHSDIKLDEFYFNFASPGGTITFDNFDPTSWTIITPASTVGGGNISFLFEANDPAGPPSTEVNVSQALTFDMNTSFSLIDDYFFDAAENCSTDDVLGCGQLGAHVQSLALIGDPDPSTDSGFVLGGFEGGGQDQGVIPEPSTFILLGAGLIGLVAYRRKKH